MEFAVTAVLIAMGIFGVVAVIPYAFTMNREQLLKAPLPLPKLALASAVQGAVLVTISVVLGTAMGREIVLGAPLLEKLISGEGLPANFGQLLLIAVVLGALTSACIVAADRLLFMPQMPEAFHKVSEKIALWKRFLAGFYGGITEEILMRLFLMTLIVWLAGKVWMGADGLPADGAYWLGNVLAALIFGAAHLPATRLLAPLTPLIVVRGLVLNAVFGIVAGVLFWQYGLLVAMVAHFTGDMVLHVIAPALIRSSKADTVQAPSNGFIDSAA